MTMHKPKFNMPASANPHKQVEEELTDEEKALIRRSAAMGKGCITVMVTLSFLPLLLICVVLVVLAVLAGLRSMFEQGNLIMAITSIGFGVLLAYTLYSIVSNATRQITESRRIYVAMGYLDKDNGSTA